MRELGTYFHIFTNTERLLPYQD